VVVNSHHLCSGDCELYRRDPVCRVSIADPLVESSFRYTRKGASVTVGMAFGQSFDRRPTCASVIIHQVSREVDSVGANVAWALERGIAAVDSNEVEFHGKWWVSGDDANAVGGVLSRKSEVWELTAMGPLGGFGAVDEVVEVIDVHGSVNGKKFSLLDVHLVGRRTSVFDEVNESRLSVQTVLSGGHVVTRTTYSRAVVSVRHLDEWANRRTFNNDHAEGSMLLAFEPPEMLNSSIGFGTIWLHKDARSRIDWLSGGSIEATERVQFELSKPRGISWIDHQCVRPLRSLMALAADSPSEVLRFELAPAGDDFVSLEVLPASRDEVARPVHPFEFIFNLADIDFEESMSAWWALYERIGIALDLLESLRGPGFISNHFLNAASAVESYHTHTTKKDKKSSAHRQRVKRIVETAPSSDQDWLKKKLAFSHKTDFIDRVAAVMERAGPVFLHAVGSPDDWSDWVKKGRNSVAHRAPGMLNIEDEWETTIRVTDTLRWLLSIVVLRDLGLTESVIEEGVQRSGGLRYASDRLRVVQPDWFAGRADRR